MTLALWQWVDRPGHEAARLTSLTSGWRLSGAAAFADQGTPCSLTYEIECSESWRTMRARVSGWVGERDIDIRVDNGWWMNGAEVAAVRDCIDIDLNFSPSTNLLPIRRLNLAPGQSEVVTAAWLRFPSFALEPFPQRYTRIDDTHVHYRSLTSNFEATLTVDGEGMVVDYEGVWRSVKLTR